jgi:hypothetical protein
MYTGEYMNVCLYIYMCTHTYICIYIHIYVKLGATEICIQVNI